MNTVKEEVKKGVEKLLKLHREYYKREEKLEEFGVCLTGSCAISDERLFQVALDLLGVPEGISETFDMGEGMKADTWSRTWADNIWEDMIFRKADGYEDYRGFIEKVLSELENQQLTQQQEEK